MRAHPLTMPSLASSEARACASIRFLGRTWLR
nr:MAG TPA: hypothetical protein [Bacteriophage sp.]